MNIADRVFNILTNGNTLKINFWFKGVNGNQVFVLAPDFIMAAYSIKSNAITIVEGYADPGKAIYTAKNDGALRANTMYIGATNFLRSFEALVVHETVHAIHDLRRAVIPWMDSEVAAYIAQGFYANNAGVPDNGVNQKEYILLGKLIADDFALRGQIDDVLLDELRDKLRNDPDYAGYINKTFVGDGGNP